MGSRREGRCKGREGKGGEGGGDRVKEGKRVRGKEKRRGKRRGKKKMQRM